MPEARLPGTRKSGSLRGTALLADIGGEEPRQALQAAAGALRSVRAHVDVVSEGAPVDQLHVVVEGWACRYKSLRDGNRQIVGLVMPGDVANLDALLFGRSGGGVRTLTPAKLVAVPRAEVHALAERHVGIGRMLTRLALIDASVLAQWALCLGRMTAQQRLAHLLCELKERLCPRQAANEVTFELPLTQDQIADALGLTAVHVNRTLQALRAERLVAVNRRVVSLLDMARLRELAEFDATYLRDGRGGARPALAGDWLPHPA